MRSGSITLGFIIGLGLLATGEGVAIWLIQGKRAQERTEAQAAAQDAAGALAECQAREVPEALQASAQGTTDALSVALAADVAEVALRADFVRSVQSAELTAAMVKHASPQLLAAERAMDRCASLMVSKGADLGGCGTNGPVVAAWADAVAALPACPEVRE
jgi:hypothetical protein